MDTHGPVPAERVVGLLGKQDLVFGQRIGRFKAFLGDVIKIWRGEMTADTLVAHEM